MLVAMTVLPHAVAISTAQVTRFLYDHPAWQAETLPCLEDNVHMQPVQFSYEKFSPVQFSAARRPSCTCTPQAPSFPSLPT